MPPRRAPRPETSRERIRSAAVALFARYGFEGVGMQRIADEVGLHKSSLFHHFATKHQLVMEVCDVAIASLVDTVQPLAEDDPPRLDRLLDVLDRVVDFFSDSPATARLLVQVMIAPPEAEVRTPVTPDADHPVVVFFTIVWSWLDRARRAGAIRKVNIRQTVFNIIGVMLLYPAAAEQEPALVGTEPFSAKARAHRKREIRFMVRGMLATDPPAP